MTAMNTGIAAGMTNHLPLERLMVFTGNANPRLAQEVAKHLNLSLGRAIVGKFSDGEVMVELLENVPTIARPSDRLRCFATSCARRALALPVNTISRSSGRLVMAAAIPVFIAVMG